MIFSNPDWHVLLFLRQNCLHAWYVLSCLWRNGTAVIGRPRITNNCLLIHTSTNNGCFINNTDVTINEIEIAILAHNETESKSKSRTVTKTIFPASHIRLMHTGKLPAQVPQPKNRIEMDWKSKFVYRNITNKQVPRFCAVILIFKLWAQF